MYLRDLSTARAMHDYRDLRFVEWNLFPPGKETGSPQAKYCCH